MEFLRKTIKNKNQKGLSLIELLLVVAVIALLIIVGIISMKPQLLKSRNARRKADIGRIKIAVEEYEKDYDCYPKPELVKCDENGGAGLSPYLAQIPCDFVTGKSYLYEVDDKACHSWYRIYTNMEYVKDPDVAKLNCLYGCGPDFAYNYYQASPNAPLPSRATSPTAPPVATSTPGPSGVSGQLYGCFSGVCTPISSDENGKGECQPNFSTSNCNGGMCQDQYGEPASECIY